MFEIYLFDASRLIDLSKNCDKDDEAIFLRSAIWHLTSAIEAYVNTLANGLENLSNYSETEISFLRDKKLEVIPTKGNVGDRTSYNPIKDKLKFLVKKHSIDSEKVFNTAAWSQYPNFKRFRDSLMHPNEDMEALELSEYKLQAKQGLIITVEMLQLLNKAIYHKDLRKGILDLADT